MKAASWQRIDEYWTRELGLDSSPGDLPPVSCRVSSPGRGVQVFRNHAGVVITSPPRTFDRLRDAIAGLSPVDVFAPEWLARALGNTVERILGPAALHYADETTFSSTTKTNARALTEPDARSHHAFVSTVAPDVEESGIPAEIIRVFGAFEGDTLCGVASYDEWQSVIAQISVVTDPAYRRRGFAKASVSALAHDALERDLLLQWRAQTWNQASLALARDLGFEYYASTIFARLRES